MRFRLEHAAETEASQSAIAPAAEKLLKDFTAALASDLNISAGLAALFGFVKEVNVVIEQGGLAAGDKARVLDVLAQVDSVLAVIDPAPWGSTDAAEDEGIQQLVDQRDRARHERDFATADQLRNELDELGIVIEDTPEGSRWHRK